MNATPTCQYYWFTISLFSDFEITRKVIVERLVTLHRHELAFCVHGLVVSCNATGDAQAKLLGFKNFAAYFTECHGHPVAFAG